MREGLYRDGAKQGTQRRPLLRASSPLKPKINRGLTLRLVRRTGALQRRCPIQFSRNVQADFFGSKQNSISFPFCCLGVQVGAFRKFLGI